MTEQKKPKIDLKARLGKKTVAVPTGPAIPPPVGIPKPPAMGGMSPSAPPPRPSNPYVASAPGYPPQSPYQASNPYAAAEAPMPVRRMEPQAITVEMSDEMLAEQRKARRRGFSFTIVLSMILGALGFVLGGRVESGKGAKAAMDGARDLVKEIEAADKEADKLNEVLAKASERLSKNEFPDEEITALGGINIPFDGNHLTDKGIGRFKGGVVKQLITYANTAQKANDQKEKIQSLLSGSKAGITEILGQKTDPKVRWGVWVEGGPNGPWANMQILPAAFAVKTDWPAEIQIPKGNEKATLKRYKSGDLSSGDPQFLPVAPQTESMVCPSTTIVRLRQELQEMQVVLKGDQTPGVDKTGFLQMGEQVVQALKKLLQS